MSEEKIIATLHPLELEVLPALAKHADLASLIKATGLKEVEVMRALQWLSNKNIINVKITPKEILELDENGRDYAKNGLPERRFLETIKSKEKTLAEIAKALKLEKNEVNACIGKLKKKAAINILAGMKISISDQGKKSLEKDSLEESFLKKLAKGPVELQTLSAEEKFAYDTLKDRKEMVKTTLHKLREAELTALGKKLTKTKIKAGDFIDRITPEILGSGEWKKKKIRQYDIKADVSRIYGGKRHFVRSATEYAKKVWMDMGFKEMEGPMLDTSFWAFDALYTAQDHPVRDLQDTFYIQNPVKGDLPDKLVAKRVKEMHEKGGDTPSKGWEYQWGAEEAQKNVLRPHTTNLSAQTLAKLKDADIPAKFFAVGRCYRNESLDWGHLFEFNQTEGIVIDPDANFRHLLGYLKNFFAKMGFPKARFRPAHFPYTEPSVEIDVYHPVHKEWFELGGAGVFRPEVVIPLLGKDIPVLAWGPGFDRIIMDFYKITDIRDLYKNDIKQIREMRAWTR